MRLRTQHMVNQGIHPKSSTLAIQTGETCIASLTSYNEGGIKPGSHFD